MEPPSPPWRCLRAGTSFVTSKMKSMGRKFGKFGEERERNDDRMTKFDFLGSWCLGNITRRMKCWNCRERFEDWKDGGY